MTARYDIFFKLYTIGSPRNLLTNGPDEPIMKTFTSPYTYINPFATNANLNPSFPPQMFNGSQLVSLYNVDAVPVASGKKQVKIAIIIAFTYSGLLADLKTYWQNNINFGPNSTPPKVNVYTMPGAKTNVGWAQEECLDLQMVCTMNPNANIWVVEAKSDLVSDLLAAVDYATGTLQADVLSMSWGLNDSTWFSSYNNRFTNTNVCYCAASGDSNNASWPSVMSNCISVGGTTLLWTPNSSTPRTEYTWNSAGCGYAASSLQPTYQQNITGIARTMRAIPDVSMVANQNTGVYIVYNGKWYSFGGTSVAAPLFAGILSLANQQRFNAGKGALTTVYSKTPNVSVPASYVPPPNNVQQYLYKTIYTSSKYANDFYDVAIGSNKGSVSGNSAALTTYNAGAKYDLTTGLGSPNCKNLCNDLLAL
jgi:subtilase family serine protease